jgi:hypothetical protein
LHKTAAADRGKIIPQNKEGHKKKTQQKYYDRKIKEQEKKFELHTKISYHFQLWRKG